MKANFKIETEYLKKALEIFDDPESEDYESRIRKVCFFPYGKWTLMVAMTMTTCYAVIIKNRIPQPFSLLPETELLGLIDKYAKISFIVNFEGLGAISYIHPDQWKEYELDCVQITTANHAPEQKFIDKYFNVKHFLSVLNGKSSKKLSEYEKEHNDDMHMKIKPKKWMVGKFFKIYPCKNMDAAIFRTKDNSEIYIAVDWFTEEEDGNIPSLFSNFMDLLDSSEKMTAEEVRVSVLVDCVHGIHQPKIFVQKFPHLCLQHISQEDVDFMSSFYDSYKDADDYDKYWEIWDELTNCTFEWEGEEWGLMITPHGGDVVAYNVEDYDSLPVEEQNKFFS